MGSIKNVVSEPIEGHEDYHMMVSNVSTLINNIIPVTLCKYAGGRLSKQSKSGTDSNTSLVLWNVNIVCCHNVNILGGVWDICYSVELWAGLTRVAVPFNILHLVTVTAV